MLLVLVGSECIVNMLVFFVYMLILYCMVYFFCIMLLFVLVVDLYYMILFILVFIFYMFIVLDVLVEELEDLFGIENNDLLLDVICNVIEIDLL